MNISAHWQVLIGILIPFAGTTLGSALVFLLKNEIKPIIQKIMLGFASGVMIAASIWSLLIPAIEMAQKQNIPGWIPSLIGFMLGVFMLIMVNIVTEKIEKNKTQNKSLLTFAVTLHNIPEGRFQSRQSVR